MSKDNEHRIRDYVENVPWEDVPAVLESRRQRIVDLIQKIKTQRERNDENVLFSQCLAKACELIELFSKAWRTYLPQGCVATRCMFELDLLTRLFEQEPASRMKFYYSVLWEEKQEVEAFLAIDSTGDATQALRERLKQLEEIQKRYNLSPDKDHIRLNWSELARRFRVRTTDYETIYRWSSRMLHITPYSVLRLGREPTRPEETATWNLLLVITQVYLGDLLQRISGILNLKFEIGE